jgi:hypothetical protein
MEKGNPPVVAGWVGKNFVLSPYPHAGIVRQQHIAQAVVGKNILSRIGRDADECQRAGLAEGREHTTFLHPGAGGDHRLVITQIFPGTS